MHAQSYQKRKSEVRLAYELLNPLPQCSGRRAPPRAPGAAQRSKDYKVEDADMPLYRNFLC